MIQIENLTKNYPDFCLNLSLELPKGRVTGIVGRNGAGKSTTIKAILGLIQPDGGTVKVFGKEAHLLTGKDKEHLGVALAESGFSGYLHMEAVAHILGRMYPRFDRDAFLRLAKEQQLPLRKPIKDFSTGMKAKLRVLSAMSHKAELLILDEPTAGLDVVARNEILDLLRSYLAQDEERSILITSHISSDLEGLCDEIYLIHDGKVLLREDTDVLLSSYAVLKLSAQDYEKLDKRYLLATNRSPFGYLCLTGEKQFYADNYPDIVIENGSIDELIVMLTTQNGGNV